MKKSITIRSVIPDRILIESANFPESQYIKQLTNKKQICWHHTASGPGSRGDINSWLSDTTRVATPVIIDHLGKIISLFDSRYFAHHLGIKSKVFDILKGTKYNVQPNIQNLLLNERCLGIEIDNWGPLRLDEKTGLFYAWPNDYGTGSGNKSIVDDSKVIEFDTPYKGKTYYEKYTDEQLEAAMFLSAFWCLVYEIDPSLPTDRTEFDNRMFNVCIDALGGMSGMFTHASYRSDKYDLSPQAKVYDYMHGVKDIYNKHI